MLSSISFCDVGARSALHRSAASLPLLHFQLMLISHGKGLFDQVRTSSRGDAAGMQFWGQTSSLWRLSVPSPAAIIRARFRLKLIFISLLDYRLL